jgi:hypothetical protein
LISVSAANVKNLENAFTRLGQPFWQIGSVVEGSGVEVI